MKTRSFLAGAFLLAAPAVALVPGCGGGGSGSPFPTPTVTALPTNTPLPAFTSVPQDQPRVSLLVDSQSNDGSSFGPVGFGNVAGVATQTSSLYTVTYTDAQGRKVRLEIPDPGTITPPATGKTFSLPTSQATLLVTTPASGTTPEISWGGTGYSQGRIDITGFSGGIPSIYVFELKDVVLSRRPASSGSNPGQSQLKLTGAFLLPLPATN